MNQKERELIAILKLCLMIGVVFIHAPKLSDSIVIEIFSERIPFGSVSTFFLLSGLFLLKKDLLNIQTYKTEIIKRTKTLFFPFLFWNILMLILISILFKIQPDLSILNDGKYMVNFQSLKETLFAMVGIKRHPVHYQFWFVRNLMIIVILSPILSFFLQKYPVVGVPIFFVLESFFKGFGFFYLGGLIGLSNLKLSLDKNNSILLFLTTITVLILVWVKLEWYLFFKLISFLFLLSVANIVLMFDRLKDFALNISEYTFIIFALHEPTITFTTGTLSRVEFFKLNNTLIYFFIVLFSIGFSILTGMIWKKISYNTYQLATGNR
jgi:hypothetical protein